MTGRYTALPAPRTPHPNRFLAGWLLSLALHGALVAAVILFCRFVELHPSGGGGGPGGGSGTGLAFVDLSGLGTGGPVAGEAQQGESPPTGAPTASTGPEPEQTASARPVTAPEPEKARPILGSPVKPVARTRPVRRNRRPRRPEVPTAQTRTAPGPAPGIGTGQAGPDGSTAGSAGPGTGPDGSGAGSGGGVGGGQGLGKGPGVGPGQGMGEGDGMALAAVDVKPRIASHVQPEYPESARRQGLRGRIVTRFLVTAEGRVARARIVAAKPPRVFDRAVLEAVGKWRFHPAKFQGRDVAAWVMLPIRFDLKR